MFHQDRQDASKEKLEIGRLWPIFRSIRNLPCLKLYQVLVSELRSESRISKAIHEPINVDKGEMEQNLHELCSNFENVYLEPKAEAHSLEKQQQCYTVQELSRCLSRPGYLQFSTLCFLIKNPQIDYHAQFRLGVEEHGVSELIFGNHKLCTRINHLACDQFSKLKSTRTSSILTGSDHMLTTTFLESQVISHAGQYYMTQRDIQYSVILRSTLREFSYCYNHDILYADDQVENQHCFTHKDPKNLLN